MTGAGSLVEVQATAEAAVFTETQLQSMMALACCLRSITPAISGA